MQHAGYVLWRALVGYANCIHGPQNNVTVYFLITAPKKNNLRRRFVLKLERKNYTPVSAATYMTVHWRYN